MTSLYVHPRLGEVTLSQTVRARRISISVRATGAVRLSFPCGVPQKRALDFLEQKAEWIGAARERLARKRASLPPQLPPEERKARIEELRRAAKADLPGRIGRLSEATGLKCEKLSIRASRTKWGSCSGSQPHLVEPLSDDSSGAPARLCDRPRTLPHGSPRPFAPFPCLGRPSGRRA